MNQPYGVDHKKYVVRMAQHTLNEGMFLGYVRRTVSAPNAEKARQRYDGLKFQYELDKRGHRRVYHVLSVKEVPWGSR